MGGGDLNMKKSWHPVLLVNQERVWKAEKSINEEKKKLAQLRKEQEEERQLAELQRLQEASTGRKRVEKLDWMYAAPGNEGGALGGVKLGEREMEDYLLGKKRVDEVLGQGDKNVGNAHKDFIAVQNANNARDTAAKIREDPLLAIKRQELAQIEALKNRPDIRRKLKEMASGKPTESKEERKARRKAEKEDRRRERHEKREKRSSKSGYRDRDRDRDSRSPRSPEYSDDDEYERERDRKRSRRDSDVAGRRRYDDIGSRTRSRSVSPRRDRDREYRKRDDSPRRRDDYRRDDRSDRRDRDHDDRIPPPRHYPTEQRDVKPDIEPHHSRPSAMDMADRPTSSSSSRPHHQPYNNGNGNGYGNGYNKSNGNTSGANGSSSANNGQTQSLEEMRAARLAAMSSSATQMYEDRSKTLAQRAEEERKEAEKEEKMRKKYGKDDVKAVFYNQKSGMDLSETLSRRAGQGLQRERDI